MLSVDRIVFLSAISFNQPKFCPSATWNENGTTFADSSSIGADLYAIFINVNNTVYGANTQSRLIQVWFEGNNISTPINVATYGYPYSLFVTITDDIYIGNTNNNIEKQRLTSTGAVSTLNTGGICYDLFIDSNNSLYCSLSDNHQVIKRSLNNSDNQTTIVAGTGCSGFFS